MQSRFPASVLRLLQLISLRQLRASWGRTALVVGGVATGVSLMVAINVINTSVLEGFRRTIDAVAGPAALEVTLGVGEVGFPESVAQLVREDPDVLAAVPLVRGTIALADEPTEALQLFGTDLAAEEDLERYRIVTTTDRREASLAFLDPRSVFLTTAFASRHGVGLGQAIALSTPTGVQDLTVRGLLDTARMAAAFDGRIAVMDLAAAQWLLVKEGRVDQIDVVLRSGADAATVQQRLAQRLPAVLTIERPERRGAHYERILASVQAMLTGISTLCLVAGIYIIYNATSTGAVRRALVMATLCVVGAEGSTLFLLLMLEALLLGATGTLLGVAYGVVLARLLTGVVTDALGVIFQLRFSAQALTIDPGQQAMIAVAGIAAALFASYFAARRIGTLEPLDVLRDAGKGSGGQRLAPRRLVGWWLVLVCLSALAFFLEVRLQSIAWGNFGATLWNASAIVIAIPVVAWLASTLGRILGAFFGAEGRFAAASIVRSPARTGVTVAAVALVMGAAITLSSLSLSFRESLDEYVSRLLAGDLVVSATTTEGGWLETPLPEGLVDELRAVDGVRAAEALRVVPGQIYRGQRIALLALSDGLVDPRRHPALREGDPALNSEMLRAGRGVNISTSLSDRFGLHAADSIVLDTPTGTLSLPVLGVVPDYMSDRGSVILSRRLLAERWNESTISRILLFLEPGVSLDVVRGAIAARFSTGHRLKILSLPEVLAYHKRMIDRAFAFMDAIQLLIVFVTIAGIFDLLLSAITERRRELGLWRLIGADERAVRRSVIIESGTVGAIGAALGTVLGLVTAWIWIGINYRHLIGFYLDYHFALGATAWFAMLVMLMTMLAGYGAARQATRMSLLEGIESE